MRKQVGPGFSRVFLAETCHRLALAHTRTREPAVGGRPFGDAREGSNGRDPRLLASGCLTAGHGCTTPPEAAKQGPARQGLTLVGVFAPHFGGKPRAIPGEHRARDVSGWTPEARV